MKNRPADFMDTEYKSDSERIDALEKVVVDMVKVIGEICKLGEQGARATTGLSEWASSQCEHNERMSRAVHQLIALMRGVA